MLYLLMSIYLYISLYIYLVRYIYTVPLFSATGYMEYSAYFW